MLASVHRNLVFLAVCSLWLPLVEAQQPDEAKPSELAQNRTQNATPETNQDNKLQTAILPLIESHRGDVAVAVRHLKTGETFTHQADQIMPTASLIKLPLLVAVYQLEQQERLDLGKTIPLREEDPVPGAGILRDHFSVGAVLSLRDYIRLMIRYSDNTATNIVIDQVGLPVTTQQMNLLGLENTRLHSKVYRGDTSIDPIRSRKFGLGSTTASEMVQLLAMLQNGKLGNAEATKEMLDHLVACDDQSMLARFFNPTIRIAHKTGAVSNCRTDAGILFTASGPVAICVLTNENEDRRWTDDNAAEILCGKIGSAVLDRFGAEDTEKPLQFGATGRLVESLQRTLNARLKPTPGLAIDGDFGPATQAAVKRFQQANSLSQTGIMTPETWKSLGILIEQDDPIPPPEIINSKIYPTTPRPALNAPPVVTCKAWVIGDPEGNILWERASEQKLEAASTTKIMTAHVVLKMAQKKPELLNEIITFSKRADETVGSTSGIREGESIETGTLLYGLLLPSGNDAATALAEHVGKSLVESPEQDPVDRFVLEMNREAKRLGLKTAHYTNPHGLSNPEHLISAADLLRLSVVTMKNPLFRKIVATRQFGCQVKSSAGYARNLRWKNTNQLLAFEGYQGIKTGTTNAAGACLVSMGSYAGKEMIIVVLGAQSSAARYADTRNLFRWAWSQQSPQPK
ncbi:MAG: hypothetical protein GY904_11980 [Planctomycetaceae bacterium]|nr:hypothetical protein [Planctomycetaceae bacterium]